jgi:hypothetical protein
LKHPSIVRKHPSSVGKHHRAWETHIERVETPIERGETSSSVGKRGGVPRRCLGVPKRAGLSEREDAGRGGLFLQNWKDNIIDSISMTNISTTTIIHIYLDF